MSVFWFCKTCVFRLILMIMIDNHLASDRFIKSIELNFDEGSIKKRWRRARDFFNQVEDDHWDDTLRDVKAILRYTKICPKL